MASKELRQAQAALQTLFKSSNLMSEITAYKSLGFMERLHREVRAPNGLKVYFSDVALQGFERLVSITECKIHKRGLVESGDVIVAYKKVLGRMYEEGGGSDVSCFLSEVEEVISKSIKVHEFYSALSGLELAGLDEFNVGCAAVRNPSREMLGAFVAQDGISDLAWRETSHGPWLTLKVQGSINYAERRFFEMAKTTCGLLSLAFTLSLERGGAEVRVIPGVEGRLKPGTVSWFSVDTETQNLRFKTSFDGVQRVEFTEEFAMSLMECEWFNELVRISQLDGGTDVERALRRALYWFFDAQADTSIEMKFLKYWSCIECMFSISKVEVTKQIKKGVVGILCYGGYQYSNPEDWDHLTRRVGELYAQRCDAVHDAQYSHIGFRDVVDVSKWAAVVLVEVAMMIRFGMTERSQLKRRIETFYELRTEIGLQSYYEHFQSRFSRIEM